MALHWQHRCDIHPDRGSRMSIAKRPRLRLAEEDQRSSRPSSPPLSSRPACSRWRNWWRSPRRATSGRDSSTLAGILAARKLEELRSLTWEFDVNGAPADDPSLQSSPWALQRNTPGFVDHVDQSGVIVGRDVEAPPAAAYTRRWSIEPLPASPGDALLIQVLVTQAGPGSGGPGGCGRLPAMPGW